MQSQLFLLPFAGGTSYSYQFLKPYLKKFDIVFLELPGRGRRIDEPIIKDFNLAAQDICLQIREKLSGGEFGIYGHSLGAYLALKVSNLLENKHIFPSHIVVSGNPGPRVKKKKGLYLLDNKSFIAEVKKLGGLSDEVCDNEQLMKYFIG